MDRYSSDTSPQRAAARRGPRAHAAFAALAAALAAAALAGWAAGFPLLATFAPGRPSLSPMTAIGLLPGAAAASIPRSPRVALRLGGAELAAGLAIVAAQWLGLPRSGPLPEAAWSSPITGMLFAGSGAAALLLASRRVAAGQVAAFGLLLFALLLGLGHIFSAARLYAYLPGTGVAIPTALAFGALAASMLLACRHSGIAEALSSRGAAGRPGLRLLLAGGFGVLGASLSMAAVSRGGLLDAESAALLLGWLALAVLGATLWGLAVAVDRADAARRASEQERERVQLTLAAAITHDLRSPLPTAALAAAYLRRTVAGDAAAATIDRLDRSHRRLDRLLRAMLDNLAMAGGRAIPLRPSEFGLAELALEVVEENSVSLADRVVVSGEARGRWDRDALFRVVENLLLNAAKYGAEGGAIECRVSLPEPGLAELEVENRGTPIPMAEWDAIFEAFARGKEAEVAKAGWGVGLAFSRLVAAEHGGTLRVASSDAEATVFELRLPTEGARPKG